MTDTQEEQPATPAPPRRDDGRIVVTEREWDAAAEAARHLVTPEWLEKELRTTTSGTGSATTTRQALYEPSLRQIVRTALQAINQARLGYPEGTIVYQEKGERLVAKRVWSEQRNRLEWLVISYTGGAEDRVEINSFTKLPTCTDGDSWRVASRPAWSLGPEIEW